jgi:hypothetical protein
MALRSWILFFLTWGVNDEPQTLRPLKSGYTPKPNRSIFQSVLKSNFQFVRDPPAESGSLGRGPGYVRCCPSQSNPPARGEWLGCVSGSPPPPRPRRARMDKHSRRRVGSARRRGGPCARAACRHSRISRSVVADAGSRAAAAASSSTLVTSAAARPSSLPSSLPAPHGQRTC